MRSSSRPLALISTAVVAALGLASCGGGDTQEAIPEDQESFRIGVVGENESHREVAQLAEEQLGYDVELVNFTDYNQPNAALANGDLDANWFQHIAFLAEHNISTDDGLEPIGPTAVVPLTLYSDSNTAVEDFQDGDTIAIPNDPVNQGRAINLLVAAGLLELSEENPQPEPRHIDEAASTVTVQPVDAAKTVNALESVAGSVINNNFAQDAGLNPTEEGLYADDPSDESAFPYINAFVVNEQDVENEALADIAALYFEDSVLEIDAELSAGTSVPATDVTREELHDALVDYENALQEN